MRSTVYRQVRHTRRTSIRRTPAAAGIDHSFQGILSRLVLGEVALHDARRRVRGRR
jgi:hypothetical protein